MSRHYVGIDPGITGAIAFLSETGVTVVDMTSNPRDLWGILRTAPRDGVVYIESQGAMPKQGVSSTFKTGYGYGVLIGQLAALGLPYHTVSPVVWKRQMGLQGKDKDASRALARSLWPDAPLARVKDHGRAEALLLAEYGRRQP